MVIAVCLLVIQDESQFTKVKDINILTHCVEGLLIILVIAVCLLVINDNSQFARVRKMNLVGLVTPHKMRVNLLKLEILLF